MAITDSGARRKRLAIGIILRRHRKKVKGRTVEMVAEEAGIDPLYLLRIEAGRWLATDQTLEKISRVVGVKLQDVKNLIEETSRMTVEDLMQKIREV